MGARAVSSMTGRWAERFAGMGAPFE